jgi:D-alanine-D-alanine ligase
VKVAVLMGGTSDERHVSLATGVEVCAALRTAGHQVVAVDTAHGALDVHAEAELRARGVEAAPPAGLDALDPGALPALVRSDALADVDVFFVALHGGAGEDGTVQALLDVMGVAYTGSDRLGCTLAMDKEVTKRLLRDAGVPTPPWRTGLPEVDEVVAGLGLPVIVKAAGGGSSLRLHLCRDEGEVAAARRAARDFGDLPLWEAFVPGREFTVGVVGDEAFPVGEIVSANEIFDYEAKYQPGMAEEIFPADLPAQVAADMRGTALAVHRLLRLRDVSRVDFMLDAAGVAWCLEANALPGLTATSLLPRAARAAGVSFPELCDRIVRLAAARRGR